MYQSFGHAAAKARYSRIDIASKVEGASPHKLIAVLYEELLKTLDTLAVGLAANGTLTLEGKIQRRGRANGILLGLEASLDHRQGGEIAGGLAAVYREARRLIGEGIAGNDPVQILQAREMIAEIADAWKQIGD